VSLIKKAVGVYELAKNCCGCGMGTVQGTRGRGMFAVGSHYEIGDDRAV
jgi:hypothetical protein